METRSTGNGNLAAADDQLELVAGTSSLNLDAATAVAGSSSTPANDLYDDTGALAIHKGYYKPNSVACSCYLLGVHDAEGLSEVQPVRHPAFATQFVPSDLSEIAEPLLEIDIDADSRYAGWSPGSVSLVGYGRDVTLWLKHKANAGSSETPPYAWLRSQTKPLQGSFIDQRFAALLHGLGDDFTERKGFDAVRELVGPSEYAWLDPKEQYKLRHQITDLLAAMSTSAVPSLDIHRSITPLAYHEQLDPSPSYAFVDFMKQILLAREATLRIQRDSHNRTRPWYGGITLSVIFDMIAADRWARHMLTEPAAGGGGGGGGYRISPSVLNQQLDGLLTFVDEMQWPFGHEIHDAVAPLHEDNATFDISLMDWVAGFILPGATYPLRLIGPVYTLSRTLSPHPPTRVVNARQGNYGLVFPQASYWHARSVVGKVLAPLSLLEPTEPEQQRFRVRCLGGWVGPCPASEEPLPASTFGLLVSVAARPPTFDGFDLEDEDRASDQGDKSGWPPFTTPPELSAPLSCTRDPVSVSLQTMTLSKARDPDSNAEASSDQAPLYSVAIDFHLSRTGTAIPLRLNTNSVFIAAPPCQGTHRVSPDKASLYTFVISRVEDLPQVEAGGGHQASGCPGTLVIDARAGPESEVFARAWCCHVGRNAVVWKPSRGGSCCFKCALMIASVEGLGTAVVIVC